MAFKTPDTMKPHLTLFLSLVATLAGCLSLTLAGMAGTSLLFGLGCLAVAVAPFLIP